MLTADILRVCHHLLPRGTSVGDEYQIGNVQGEPGDSLNIHLTGTKAGVWSDFATGESGGDLIDLWMHVKGISLTDALAEIKAYLGIEETFRQHYEITKTYKTPSPLDKPVKMSSAVGQYLEERGLTEETAKAFCIEQAMKGGNHFVVFPSYNDGVLTRYKFRTIETKDFHTSPNAEPLLFGWQALDKNAREVTIDEGEFNAMSLYQYGYPALAVPFGASNSEWIEHEYDKFDRFDVIYIRADDDPPGMKMVDELVNRFGRHRCKVLHFPEGMDPNDCLQAGYSKEDIDKIYAEATYNQPAEICDPSSLLQDVIREFYPDPHVKQGFVPRFAQLQADSPQGSPKLEFRYGEVTIWGGYNFEGKSQVIKQMQLDSTLQNEKSLVLDLEMQPKKTLRRLVSSITADSKPHTAMIEKAVCWLDGQIWLYDTRIRGIASVENIINLFRYAVKRFGITQFYIDSLMRIKDVPEDDYNAQREAVNAFCDFAMEYNVHVHIVAHFRKPANMEGQTVNFKRPPNRFNISGSSKFSDAAFNVILIHRNRDKEHILKNEMEVPEGLSISDIEAQPDALFNIDKQKNGDNYCGYVKLWWHQEAQQFLNGPNDRPFVYLQLNEKFK